MEFYRLLVPDDQDDELGYESAFYEDPFQSLLRRGWKLDRSHPGALLWTTPSGRRYKSSLDGSSCVPYLH
jgi:hypothetical protein